MSMRYPGGLIANSPVNAAYPSGVWTQPQTAVYNNLGVWQRDPYFDFTTLLLHGDGTNGAQNNTFLDSSTNNFTITRNGNTTQGAFTPYTASGYWGSFFAGGASGGYITSSTSADYTFGTGDFTIEGFVFVTGTGTGIFQQGTSNFPTSTTNTVALGTNGGTPTWQMYAKNAATNSTATWTSNTWYHFAVVRSGTTTTLYINGSSVITVTGDSTNYTGTNFGIGSIYGTGSSERFTGYLSNIRVVKGAAVYTANFTPPTSPLTSFGSGTNALIALQSNRYIDTLASPKTLTVTGDTSVQQFNPFGLPTNWSAPVLGGSGYFDGSGDYLTAPDSTAFTMGAGDFSVEFWYYPTNAARQLLVAQTNSVGNTVAFWVEKNASNQLRFVVTVGGTQYVGTATATINLNAWTFIQVVRSGTTVYGYQNGAQVCSASVGSGSLLDSTDVVEVGGVSVGLPVYGYMSDVRVLKGTASAATTPTAPLTAITNTSLLLNFTNAGIFDNAQCNNLETVGNAQVSTSVVKYNTGSMAFDGSGDYLVAPSRATTSLEGDFTIELWAYRGATGNFRAWCIGDSFAASGIELYTSGSNNWIVWSGNANQITAGAATRGVWTHLALVRSGSTVTVYVNGTASGSTWSSSSTFSGNVLVGAELYNGTITADTNGYIDDLRITKGYARYIGNFTPPVARFPNQG